jgi:hypothetical protein
MGRQLFSNLGMVRNPSASKQATVTTGCLVHYLALKKPRDEVRARGGDNHGEI